MSKRKHHRKKVAELELQIDQLFEIVSKLADVTSHMNGQLIAMPAAIGSAIGSQLSTSIALTERNTAAGNGLHVNH